MVEAALILPIFILILGGMLDFGWVLANQLMVNNGSRDGARWAIVNSTSSNWTDQVTARVHQSPGLESTELVTVTAQKINSSKDIQVAVAKKVKVLTPLTGIFFENQETVVESMTIMRIE
jgi:Flp pilus assembly protein TadG